MLYHFGLTKGKCLFLFTRSQEVNLSDRPVGARLDGFGEKRPKTIHGLCALPVLELIVWKLKSFSFERC